jgi:hypothetical protein
MDEETREALNKILAKIKTLEEQFGHNTVQLTTAPEKKLSLKEFMLSKSPNNDVKKATCVGYYLEKFEGKKSFTNKDITDGFRRAKYVVPLNVPDKIQKAISNGWFDHGEKKYYVLTMTGEKAVESKFSSSKND